MNEKIIDKIVQTSNAAPEEIVELLKSDSSEKLFEEANRIKNKLFGKHVILRGIIEFSNYCRCECAYCGIYCRNKKIRRFRLPPDEIVDIAEEAYQAGYRSIILQSGEDLHYNADMISDIIKRIKKIGDLSITLSIGERTFEEYRQWRKDGADRYLLKHETADEKLYNLLHPHSNFKNRLKCLLQLKEAGYQTGSGFMVGLPGQTAESLAQDILLLKELDVDMAGIGIFIAHPETPLGDCISGNPDDALKCLAITRILLKRPHLPATTSVEVGSKNKYGSLFSGANVIMKKTEPYVYRKMYEIYPNPQITDKSIIEERRELEKYIKSLGLIVDPGKGDAIMQPKL